MLIAARGRTRGQTRRRMGRAGLDQSEGTGRRGSGAVGFRRATGRGTIDQACRRGPAEKAQVYADAQLRDKDERHGLIVAKGPR
jgi:hypothetical protein